MDYFHIFIRKLVSNLSLLVVTTVHNMHAAINSSKQHFSLILLLTPSDDPMSHQSINSKIQRFQPTGGKNTDEQIKHRIESAQPKLNARSAPLAAEQLLLGSAFFTFVQRCKAVRARARVAQLERARRRRRSGRAGARARAFNPCAQERRDKESVVRSRLACRKF